jgi:hypothetical protein
MTCFAWRQDLDAAAGSAPPDAGSATMVRIGSRAGPPVLHISVR